MELGPDKLFRLRNLLHRCGIPSDDIPDDVLSDGWQMLVEDVVQSVCVQFVKPDYRTDEYVRAIREMVNRGTQEYTDVGDE